MNFNIYDKYILDILQSKAKTIITQYKDSIKNEYLNIAKIIKETPTINSQSASSLIKTKESFVTGVDFFDNKKTDFYLLSDNGITIPISVRDTLEIKDKKQLAISLFKRGHIDSFELEIRPKKEILENEVFRKRYGFKTNESTDEMARTFKRLSGLNIESVDSSFFKRNNFNEKDTSYIQSNANKITKQFISNISIQEIDKEETIEILKERGFENYRKINKYFESISQILAELTFDLSKSKLYQKIESQRLQMPKLDFNEQLLEKSPFLKISINEKKVIQILRKEDIESASIIKGGIVKINKPICTVEEYESFLKIEEYIKKNTQNKIKMDIYNVPTLENIFEQEFGMRK